MSHEMDFPVGTEVVRPWGGWKVLDSGENFRVKRLDVEPGKRLSLQSHNHRSERWIIAQGRLKIEIDDAVIEVGAGDMVLIEKGQKHRPMCISKEKAVIIEVWRGDKLMEDDIVRYEDDYGRK